MRNVYIDKADISPVIGWETGRPSVPQYTLNLFLTPNPNPNPNPNPSPNPTPTPNQVDLFLSQLDEMHGQLRSLRTEEYVVLNYTDLLVRLALTPT